MPDEDIKITMAGNAQARYVIKDFGTPQTDSGLNMRRS